MNRSGLRRAVRPAVLALSLAVAGAAVGQAMQELTVNRPDLPVFRGKGAIYAKNPVTTVNKGDKLQVLAREENGWLRVRAGDKEGYVREEAINAKDTKAADGIAGLLGGTETTGAQAGAAGKGLEEETIAYADAKGLDKTPLQRMIGINQRITPEQYEQFARSGQLGAYKRR